jgi:hypothetical protein
MVFRENIYARTRMMRDIGETFPYAGNPPKLFWVNRLRGPRPSRDTGEWEGLSASRLTNGSCSSPNPLEFCSELMICEKFLPESTTSKRFRREFARVLRGFIDSFVVMAYRLARVARVFLAYRNLREIFFVALAHNYIRARNPRNPCRSKPSACAREPFCV